MDSKNNLFEIYSQYLQNAQDAELHAALPRLLTQTGYPLEGSLLQQYFERGPCQAEVRDGPWKGRQAFVSPLLPIDARPGDLWLDTLELSTMLLLPSEGAIPGERYSPEALARMSPLLGWMAVRPTANWQFAAFLLLAKVEPCQVQLIPPFKLLDMQRSIRGSMTDPVTHITCPEALIYASWFGKGLCGQDEWQAAARLLPRSLWEARWEPLRREWAGAFSEGVYAVATPSNVFKDWDELFEDPRSQKEMFFDEWQAPPGVGFRTRALSQFGLLKQPWHDPGAMVDVQLMEVLKRAA